jgi:hypothetical protein
MKAVLAIGAALALFAGPLAYAAEEGAWSMTSEASEGGMTFDGNHVFRNNTEGLPP